MNDGNASSSPGGARHPLPIRWGEGGGQGRFGLREFVTFFLGYGLRVQKFWFAF